MGVAVQSHAFSVGSIVTWARAGVGAVATQSLVEISYGPLGLELMSSGKNAKESLETLVKGDKKSDTRQVAMIDAKGSNAVHTGNKCIPFAGHIQGSGFSCQANLMRNDTIWNEMAKSFQRNSKMEFPERLVSALEAGEKAGGDVRGKQSAAILVVSPNVSANSWSGCLVDLRIEDHRNPIPELKRLVRLNRGYEWANLGDEFLNNGKFDKSLDAYQKAFHFAPEIEELQFWQAVSLVQSKRAKDAIPIFRKVFSKNKTWRQVVMSLSQVGMIPDDTNLLRTILK